MVKTPLTPLLCPDELPTLALLVVFSNGDSPVLLTEARLIGSPNALDSGPPGSCFSLPAWNIPRRSAQSVGEDMLAGSVKMSSVVRAVTGDGMKGDFAEE